MNRPRKAAREESGGPTWVERLFFGSVSLRHKATFCRQAAAYLESGVDLLKTLESLRKQFSRTALGPVLDRVHQSVRRGDTIAEAFAREPQAFDPEFLSTMKVAEARGGVPEILKRLATHYEARLRLLRQARSAMIYPAAVILVLLVVAWLITAFVLPALVEVLNDMVRGRNAELPAITRALIAVSAFMRWIGWWALPLAAIASVFLGGRWYRTAAGKAAIDRFALIIPVIGPLLIKLDTARFARSMSTLLEAGVDIGQSIDLTSIVVRTDPFQKAVRSIRPEVMAGSEVSTALSATRRFPADAIAILETGESTGKLPESLDRLANDYEEQVEYTVKNLGQLIQPLITIVLGGFVLLIVLALFLAYIQLITGLSAGL